MIKFKKVLYILKITAKISWWCVTVLVALLIISIISAKAKGEVPYFFGYSVMNIVSDSMEDKIPEGTFILIKKTDPSNIKQGDIICFYSDDPAIKDFPNTHVVVEDPICGENGLEFVTKGTANPTKDNYTAKEDKLIGKYITNLDGLTHFNEMLQGDGIFVFLIVLMSLCAVFMIVTIFIKISDQSIDTKCNQNISDSSDPRE